MNATRITLHVMAESRIEAFHQALRAVLNLSHAPGVTSSASSEGGSYRADIETITVPDDDDTPPPHWASVGYPEKSNGSDDPDFDLAPPFGAHTPHPVTKAEAGL